MGFAENLSKLQAERGETNYKLAKALGVSQTTVANWLGGISVPRKLYLDAVAVHYGVTKDELLADEQ